MYGKISSAFKSISQQLDNVDIKHIIQEIELIGS
jgi:hypothetical protein